MELQRKELERRMQFQGTNRTSIINNASRAIERFLKSTNIPYVVIGGKAAMAYLTGVQMPLENRVLVQSTNDWDVVVQPQYAKRMVDEMAAVLRKIVPPNMLSSQEHTQVNAGTDVIYLMGFLSQKFQDSLVDIHVKKALPPATTIQGIRYATRAWLLEQIEKYLGSANSPLKAMKRTKRQTYLRQVVQGAGQQLRM